MGLSPRDVDALSPWEFRVLGEGYARAHGGGRRPPSGAGWDEAKLAALGIEGFDA